MNLPKDYNKKLQRWDDMLRMRWSQQLERWVLERKYRRALWSLTPGTLTDEAFLQMRDGYTTLGTYDPRELPNIDRLILHLGWADTWRTGLSPEQYADTYEDNSRYKEEARNGRVKRHLRDRASSTWDDVTALTGAKSYAKHTGFR